MSVLYYDKQGKPMNMEQWLAVFRDEEYRRIGSDTVGEVWVSTVWLGIDMGFGGGVPIIFETMCFEGEHDQEMDRYATEEQARRGHAAVVANLKAGRPPFEEDG